MDRFKNEIINDKFKINIGIDYDDIVSFVNKDILYGEIDKVVNSTINNKYFRSAFFEYIYKNKKILKPIVWDFICKKVKTKDTDIIDVYLQVFYTRIFEYCDIEEDFVSTLEMTPDVEKVLKRFINILFISTKDIDNLYNNLLVDLIDEEEFFTNEEFEEILRKEFFENIIKL